MCPNDGRPVAQDTLDHNQIAPGLHGTAGLHHTGNLDIAHCPDSKAAEYVAAYVDVSQEVDVPRGKVNVARDLQHRLDLEAAARKFHIARD